MTPKSEDELARLIREADGPLRIAGGGTRMIRACDGETLSTSALSGVTLYEPGALTLVAQAGTPVAEIEAALDAEGQMLAFEPMDHRGLLGTSGTPTIGGAVAANVSGPRRVSSVGACRDSLLGVRFVDGSGTLVKNGGRVMKNVTGYDLTKLMAGSFGTLGVLTEVALKVLPRKPATAVLLREGLDDETAITALCRALGSPYEVTGAAHLQRGLDGAPVTMIRLEGSEASTAYRSDALCRDLAEFGSFTIERDPVRTRDCWRDVRDVARFHDRAGDIWRLSVKPTDAPGIVAAIDGAEAVYDWAGGLIWLCVPKDTDADRVRRALAGADGHATLVRGTVTGNRFHHAAPAVAALQAGLRHRFDPRGILNPGLMG